MRLAKIRESLGDILDFLDLGLEYLLNKGEVANGGTQQNNSRFGDPGDATGQRVIGAGAKLAGAPDAGFGTSSWGNCGCS